MKSANAMDFGAKGDGVTDDTRAIQDALDSLRPTITEQLVKALRDIADIKRTQLQEGNCGQDPTYEGYWSVLNRAREKARAALAAYEASKADTTYAEGGSGMGWHDPASALPIVPDTPAPGLDIEGLVEVAALAIFEVRWRGVGPNMRPQFGGGYRDEAMEQARAALLAVQQKLRGGE